MINVFYESFCENRNETKLWGFRTNFNRRYVACFHFVTKIH